MKIPFDIKCRPQIESGEYKVETRDGKPVRIICWDRFAIEPYNNCNIVALVTGTKYESTYYYYQDGHLWNKANGEKDSPLDLFIISPEPEPTEFEEGVRQVVVSALSGETPNGSGGTMSWAVALSDDDVRRLAPRLLKLAKKELLGQWNENMKDEYARGKRDGLTIGYNKAIKEAEESEHYHYPFYPAMCFHGGVCTNPMRDCINCPMHSSGATTNTTTSGTCKKD